MSVAIDPPAEDADAAAPPPEILKFLRKKNAIFANYWLDEKPELWMERWRIAGPPTVFVFDRQGKRAGKFNTENADKPWLYEDVKKLVEKLLAQSP